MRSNSSPSLRRKALSGSILTVCMCSGFGRRSFYWHCLHPTLLESYSVSRLECIQGNLITNIKTKTLLRTTKFTIETCQRHNPCVCREMSVYENGLVSSFHFSVWDKDLSCHPQVLWCAESVNSAQRTWRWNILLSSGVCYPTRLLRGGCVKRCSVSCPVAVVSAQMWRTSFLCPWALRLPTRRIRLPWDQIFSP